MKIEHTFKIFWGYYAWIKSVIKVFNLFQPSRIKSNNQFLHEKQHWAVMSCEATNSSENLFSQVFFHYKYFIWELTIGRSKMEKRGQINPPRNIFPSNHSVDPSSPYSSASQLANMIVQRGLYPMKNQWHNCVHFLVRIEQSNILPSYLMFTLIFNVYLKYRVLTNIIQEFHLITSQLPDFFQCNCNIIIPSITKWWTKSIMYWFNFT